MQIDIKVTAVEPIRQTFSNIARRLGGDKPASRYQEAMFDLQPTTNFHYRPLWQPEFEIYDVRRTGIVMKDWYAFRDPRQYYYGTYTIARSRQQESMEKSIEFVDRRGLLRDLPEEVRRRLVFTLIPLRHVEWGANSHNCYMTAYAWGTAITQATMFHTMDRLGIAQYISRIGLLIDGNRGDSLTQGKEFWMNHPAWQPLRRLAEKLHVTRDWFELFVAQNLVLDGLLHPLVFRHFESSISMEYGPALSLVSEFMTNWFDESSRWVDATVKTAAAESPANAALLRGWIAQWRQTTLDALAPYAAEAFQTEAPAALESVDQALKSRIAKIDARLLEGGS